jgi:hypothetical protein
MTARIFLSSTAILMCVACYSTQALADGDCGKGYRDTTAAERSTMTNLLTRALAALPNAPTGWVVTADGETRGVQSICRDVETAPFPYHTGRFLSRADNLEERNQKDKAVFDRANAAQAAKQPRIDALNAKLEGIAKQLGEAAGKGDFARAEALNKQVDEVSAQLRAVYDENDQTPQITAAALENQRDSEIHVEVSANSMREYPGEGAQPMAKPAGVQLAYRWSDNPTSGTQDHVLLLLGTWTAIENNGFTAAPRSGAAPVAPSSLAIRIDADAGRMQSIIAAINIADLAATLR